MSKVPSLSYQKIIKALKRTTLAKVLKKARINLNELLKLL